MFFQHHTAIGSCKKAIINKVFFPLLFLFYVMVFFFLISSKTRISAMNKRQFARYSSSSFSCFFFSFFCYSLKTLTPIWAQFLTKYSFHRNWLSLSFSISPCISIVSRIFSSSGFRSSTFLAFVTKSNNDTLEFMCYIMERGCAQNVVPIYGKYTNSYKFQMVARPSCCTLYIVVFHHHQFKLAFIPSRNYYNYFVVVVIVFFFFSLMRSTQRNECMKMAISRMVFGTVCKTKAET